MIRVRALIKTSAAVAAGLLLTGCVSLLPETEPAQLYRLQPVAPVSQVTTPAGAAKVDVHLADISFARAAAGDRILAMTGPEAAYIAQSRWVSPANVMFEEAVARAFDANTGRARLVTRGELAQADYQLRLDVRNFETVYDAGPEAAPKVVVRVRAALTRTADRSLVAEEMLETEVRASDNRVSAIVAAFDAAMAQTLAELVGWTNQAAQPTAAAGA